MAAWRFMGRAFVFLWLDRIYGLSCVGWQGDIGKVLAKIFKVSGNAYHGGVVGAELKLRDKDLKVASLSQTLHFTAKKAVGRHTSGNGHLLDTGFFDGFVQFLDKEANDALLYGCTQVGFVLLNECRVFGKTVAQEIEE